MITPNGKEIEFITAPNTSLIQCRFKGGGELPQELSGLFTDRTQAEKAVVIYLTRKTKEAKAA